MQQISAVQKAANAASSQVGETAEIPFKDVLSSAIENVKQTDAQTKDDAINLALGNIDDLHTVQINTLKATTALDFLMAVRGKALDAYQEIMRMNI